MMNSKLLLNCLAVSFLVMGCSAGITSKKQTSVSFNAGITEPQTKTIVSRDGLVKLTLPNTWQDIWTESHRQQWSLLVGERSQLTQIGVRSIAKADYPIITATMHAQAALTAGKAPFSDARIIKQNQSTQVNGYPAVLHQVEGTVAGQRLIALSLSVATPHAYHGILIISPASHFPQQQDELNQIIQTLDENAGKE